MTPRTPAASETGDPLLLTPGPLTTSASVKQAMVHDWGSRDAGFLGINRMVLDKLVELAGGQGTHVTVPVQGSGTFAVEAMLTSFVPKAGKLLVLINGAYGQRALKIAQIAGRATASLETPEDTPPDLAKLEKLLADDEAISHVFAVHCETTSGILNPIAEVAGIVARHGRRLLVDSMSAFGALEIDARQVRYDALAASSNKCLEGVPGLAFVICRNEALAECKGNATTLVLDLFDQAEAFARTGQYRFTPPIHVIVALGKAIEEHTAEGGVVGRGKRYRDNAKVLIDGMRAMGFHTLLPDRLQAPIIITFHMPTDPKFVFQRFYDGLKDKGYVIYPGKLTVADSFRMGCIGRLYPEHMKGALAAVREVLDELRVSNGGPALAAEQEDTMAPDSINTSGGEIAVNGRRYRLPKQPIVVVCIDGSEPGYIERAVEAGRAPWFGKVLTQGTSLLADCVVPSFTNPNNLSIVTGQPPAVHGICGNYFLDPDSGKEVMMNDPKFLRVETLFPAFQRAGCRIAVVTAKDKLRGLLGKGLALGAGKACSFSSEKSDQATLAENGIEGVNALVGMDVPDVYSAGLSEFVFAAGVRLMERERPQIMYLSTTDYIQHKHAPGTPVANDFYAMMDGYMARLDAMGCTIVLTADHGMNAKFGADGKPDVIYLQDVFDGWLGTDKARVILPITDPYVVHHGALGSFAVVYLPAGTTAAKMAAKLKSMPGIEAALSKEEAAQRFELPADRLGDLVVVSTKHKVLGTSAERHDLSGLTEPLRSHGGVSEQKVPLLCNRRLVADAEQRPWRNFDAFDLALNLVA